MAYISNNETTWKRDKEDKNKAFFTKQIKYKLPPTHIYYLSLPAWLKGTR